MTGPPRVAARAGRGGFTLIEILVVVTLIAIIGAIAVPRLNVAKYRADAGARLVVSIIQLAERMAVQRQHDVVVGFDLTGNRIRVHHDRNNNRAVDAGEGVQWRALEERVRFRTPPRSIGGATSGLAPVAGPNVRTIDGMPSVIVTRDGSTNTAAEIYLTSARSALSDFRAVRLSQATGRLTWFIYNEGPGASGSWTEVGR